MASLRKEIAIDAPADHVWAAIRDVGAVHTQLIPGLVTDSRLEDGVRIVTFANGLVLRELIVDVDDDARRFSYASVGGRAVHHNASMQVFPEGENRCRFVWMTDVLPDALRADVAALVDQGTTILKRHLEAAASRESRAGA